VEIHFDKAEGREYYLNRILKTKSFIKPRLLANVEVRHAPDGWQTIKDSAGALAVVGMACCCVCACCEQGGE
jgi:hypothetical protein